jgi:predicted nucleotidyltransferase
VSASTKPDLLERLAAVLQARPEVLEGYLFGSAARGEMRPHSDFDIAVVLERGTAAARGGLCAEIGADLGTALGSDLVDVVSLDTSQPLLYHRVLRDGVRIIARDLRATTRREGEALSRYCDYLPQLALIEAAHKRRIAAGAFGQ